jgi:hypothetical protein
VCHGFKKSKEEIKEERVRKQEDSMQEVKRGSKIGKEKARK